jgi:hypothetical protein
VRIEQPGRPAPPAAEEPSTADLLKGIADDASTLVKQEILLARQELTEGLTKVAKASALLVVAGVLALYALGLLFETAAWGLEALGLPKSASFGIVTLVLLIVVAILALIGQRRLAAAKVAPERAQAELKETTDTLSTEAKTAVAEVKADLTEGVQTVKEEATSAPTRVRTAAGSMAGDVREAASKAAAKAKEQVAAARDQVKEQVANRRKRDE